MVRKFMTVNEVNESIIKSVISQMKSFGFIPTFKGDEQCEIDWHEAGHVGMHFIDIRHFDGMNYRPDSVRPYVHIFEDGRLILVIKNEERYEIADTYPQLVSLFEEMTGEKIPQNNGEMCYYSTNKAMQTICKIREERRAKYNSIMERWNDLSSFVKENWDGLYFNACLLSGQTESLGIAIDPVDEDYYAPERIWVYFLRNGKRVHEVELHRRWGVKYIDSVRCYDSDTYKATPKDVLGVNLEIAKRALCVLGMNRR